MSELVEQQTELSVQSRVSGNGNVGKYGTFSMHLLEGLMQAGQLLPSWWSPGRDAELRRFVLQSDHLSGAQASMAARISAIPSHIEPRDPTVKSHRKLADEYNIIWNELSEFGQGKQELIYKAYIDWSGQDNGFFLEILGDGDKDGPIVGRAKGVANLDAARCSRTGDAEYPVVYTSTNGEKYKLHHTRVAFASSMPSNKEGMNGVGFCSISRAVNNAQHLIDIGVFEQEKLGSRPKRQMLVTQGGLDPDDVALALQMADRSMDNQQLSRYGKAILIGDATLPDANLISIDLASIPDGFDKQTSITLGMFAIALAFGVPVRWLWPASSAGATKADAMFQHIAGQGPGVGHFLSVLVNMLGGSPDGDFHLRGKFLPPELKLVFDFQDDEQDRQSAENKKIRVEGWEKHLQNATMDVRVVREQMLSAGDLSEAQFRRLELEDGRLPDGLDVLSLFSNTEPLFLRLLDLNVENPLAIELHDAGDMILEINAAGLEAQDLIVNARSLKQKQDAELALAALGKLKGVYEQILTEEIQQDQLAQQEGQGETITETTTTTEETQEEKSFNFGASVGEVIRGKLARGEGGKFVNVEQLSAKIQQDILNRLRSRQGVEGLTAAELARLENREAVLELLGGKVSAENVDALAGLRAGQQPDAQTAQALQNAGLAEIADDGTVIMTSAGRGLMKAANSGDVDSALAALQRAGKKKAPKGGKGGKGGGGQSAEDKKREAEKERLANVAKVTSDVSDMVSGDSFAELSKFNEGVELSDNARQELSNLGLVETDAMGNDRLTSNGSALLRAADKGDTRAARDAISKGIDKVDTQQQREQEEQERQEQIQANRDAVVESISDNVSPDAFSALQDFKDGQDLRPEHTDSLATNGLIEFDNDGNARLTSSGRSLLSSAEKGDTRRAQDLVSASRERVEKTAQKAQENIERAEKYEDDILEEQDKLDSKIADLEQSINDIDREGKTDQEIQSEIDEIQAKIDNEIARSQERIERWRKQAQDRRADADELLRRIGRGGNAKMLPFWRRLG